MTSTETSIPPWSPIMCLPKVTNLTPSGLLKLDVSDGEVELMRRDDMELRCDMVDPMPLPSDTNTGQHRWIDRNSNLTVTLTTHRMVFSSSSSTAGQNEVRFLHLVNVHQVGAVGGGVLSFSSYKIALHTYMGDLSLVFRQGSSGKDRDDMLKLLEKALERRAWEVASRLEEKKRTSTTIANRKVGVDAILSKNAMRHKEAARLTESAFEGDAESLLREATELVKIIQKYVVTLEKQEGSSSDDQDAAAAAKLADMLQDMGMTSALTKNDVRGNAYFTTLARQLADFLAQKLQQVGGIMTLTDVYCLYNRARGTNLISPEDLLQATSLMGSLHLGMSQREFPSGVKVVQLDAMSDEAVSLELRRLAEENVSLTALQASRALHISALLAQEQLLAAERLGHLCRDVTLEGMRFYPNMFDQFVQVVSSQKR